MKFNCQSLHLFFDDSSENENYAWQGVNVKQESILTVLSENLDVIIQGFSLSLFFAPHKSAFIPWHFTVLFWTLRGRGSAGPGYLDFSIKRLLLFLVEQTFSSGLKCVCFSLKECPALHKGIVMFGQHLCLKSPGRKGQRKYRTNIKS